MRILVFFHNFSAFLTAFYQELQQIRSALLKFSQASYSEKLLVRIEKIVPSDHQQEIQVTVWKAESYSEGLFNLSKIG